MPDFISLRSKSAPQKIAAALDAVQPTGRAFGDISVNDVYGIARKAERELKEYGVPARGRCGARYRWHIAGARCKAYKYSKPATAVDMVRGGNGVWRITSITRIRVWPRQSGWGHLTFAPLAPIPAILKAVSHVSHVPELWDGTPTVSDLAEISTFLAERAAAGLTPIDLMS